MAQPRTQAEGERDEEALDAEVGSLEGRRRKRVKKTREEVLEDLVNPEERGRKRRKKEREQSPDQSPEGKESPQQTFEFLGETVHVRLDARDSVIQGLKKLEGAVRQKKVLTDADKSLFEVLCAEIDAVYKEDDEVKIKLEGIEEQIAFRIPERERERIERVKQQKIDYINNINSPGEYKDEMQILADLIEKGETTPRGLTKEDLVAIQTAVMAETERRKQAMAKKAGGGEKRDPISEEKGWKKERKQDMIMEITGINHQGRYKAAMRRLHGLIADGVTEDGLTPEDLKAVRDAVLADTQKRLEKRSRMIEGSKIETPDKPEGKDRKSKDEPAAIKIPDDSGRDGTDKADDSEKIRPMTHPKRNSADENLPYRYFSDNAPGAVEKKHKNPDEQKAETGEIRDNMTKAKLLELKGIKNMPAGFRTLALNIVGMDHGKISSLLSLWKINEGNNTTGDPALDRSIKTRLKAAIELAEEDDMGRIVAETELRNLLDELKVKEIQQTPQEKLEANNLMELFDEIGKLPEYRDISRGLRELFEILEATPDAYGERGLLLKMAQDDLKKTILFKKLPEMLGLGKVSDFNGLTKAIIGMGLMSLLSKMPELKDFLTTDQNIRTLRSVYGTITGKTEKTTDKPASEPSTASPSAREAAPTTEPTPAREGVNLTDATVPGIQVEDERKKKLEAALKIVRPASPEEKDEKSKRAFLNYLGLKEDDEDALSRAIEGVLIDHEDIDFEALIRFMKNGGTEKVDVDALKAERKALNGQIASMDSEIKSITAEETKPSATTDRKELAQRKADLVQRMTSLKDEKEELDGLIGGAGTTKKTETKRYKDKEEMLTMINYYFEIQAGKLTGETPDRRKVIEETQRQIKEKEREILEEGQGFVGNVIGFFRPKLDTMLERIGVADPKLSKIEGKKMKELAGKQDQKAVDAWVDALPGSDEEKFKVVSSLIAHLEMALNGGKMARLNSFSLKKAFALKEMLKETLNEQMIQEQENQQGGFTDMNDYFRKLRANNLTKSKVSDEIVASVGGYKKAGFNFLKTVAVGTGVASVATFGSILALGGAGAGITGLLGRKYMKATTDKERLFYQSATLRAASATALGTAVTAAFGLGFWPVAGAVAIGSLVPEEWKLIKRAVK